MMDFITEPLIVGIVFLGIYKLFELFVCKNERLKIIEKLGDRFTAADIGEKLALPSYRQSRFSFSTLKGGLLMLGIGVGLLVGFFISLNAFPGYTRSDNSWEYRQMASIVYGSCVLLFGGIALLIAFLIEMNIGKKKEGEE